MPRFAMADQWLDTKFRCRRQAALAITAKGVVDVTPTAAAASGGPSGFQASRNGGGRSSPARRRTKIGSRSIRKITAACSSARSARMANLLTSASPRRLAETEGNLFLHIGPSPWGGISSAALRGLRCMQKVELSRDACGEPENSSVKPSGCTPAPYGARLAKNRKYSPQR